MNRPDPNPNPLASKFETQLRPLLDVIDKVSGPVFLDAHSSSGTEVVRGRNGRESRPSTVAECCRVHFAFRMDFAGDLREPIPPQLATWLADCARQIEIARRGVKLLEDPRNLDVIAKLIAIESEKAGVTG